MSIRKILLVNEPEKTFTLLHLILTLCLTVLIFLFISPLSEAGNNTAPTHSTPILNSTYGTNYSNENLTCYNQSTYDADGDSVKNIYNWYKDNQSIMVLNMPFEGGSNSSYTKDYSGYGHNGTVTSATYNSTGGYDGFGAYEFDGVDDYVVVNHANSIDFNLTDNYSISFWIKVKDGAVGTLVEKWNGNGAYPFTVRVSSITNMVYAAIYNGSAGEGNPTAHSTTLVNDSAWHLVTAVKDQTNLKMYLDGNLEATTDISSLNGDINNTDDLFIGMRGDHVNAPFNGTIDEVRIYDISLSAEQVKALYWNKTNLIVSQETLKTETWKCYVTPNDGTEDGNTKYSNNLTIRTVCDNDGICEEGENYMNCPNDCFIVELNSTYGTNYSNENLTCYTNLDDNESIKLIYNWYKNDSSLMVLNMPFEGGSNSTYTKDYSGCNNDANVNGIEWNATGGYDGFGAYEFGGSNYIYTPSIDIGSNGAIECWIKLHKLEANKGIIGLGTKGYFYIGSNNFLSLFNGSTYVGPGLNLNDFEWHHLVFTWESDQYIVYKDGAAGNQLTIKMPTSGIVRIGSYPSGSNILNGTIDEVRIYNHSLSAEQVKALYRNKTNTRVSQEIAGGEVWQCSATPNDGTEDGTTKYSNNITILNSLPTVSLIYPYNNSVVTSNKFTFFGKFYDSDNDEQYAYNLLLDNESTFSEPLIVNITNTTSATQYQTDIDRDAAYYWKMRVSDGENKWGGFSTASKFKGPYCGDGVCQSEETYDNCSQDCAYPYRENYDGFVYIKEGHFYKNGERLRFLGPSSSVTAKEGTNFTINMLAFYGFNAVRPHLYDWRYFQESPRPNNTRGFFNYTKGDNSSLDQLDYILYLAKENNLHLYLSFDRLYAPILANDSDICNECENESEWISAVENLGLGWGYSARNFVMKYIWFFDERFKRLHFEYANNILNHTNQYTDLKIKEDPSIAFFEVSNENNAHTWFLGDQGGSDYGLETLPDFFREELRMKWNDWLKDKYSNTEELSAAWNDNNPSTDLKDCENLSSNSIEYQPLKSNLSEYSSKRGNDIIRFINNLTLSYYKEFEESVRENGLKVPILYSNSGRQQEYPSAQTVLTEGDVVSAGNYYLGFNNSHLKNSDYFDYYSYDPFIWAELGKRAVVNKPHIIYENNIHRPAEYRATYVLMMTMIGSLQDWDGIFFHNMYPQTKDLVETGLDGSGLRYKCQTKPLNQSRKISGCDWYGVNYDNDEVFLSAILGSSYFTRFLVDALEAPITLVVGTDNTAKANSLYWSNIEAYDSGNITASSFYNPFRVRYYGNYYSYLEGPSLHDFSDVKNSGNVSGDKLYWDLEKGIFSYDSDKLKMYTGFVGNNFSFNGVSIDEIESNDSVYSSFVLQSLDKNSINESGNLSLIMLVDAENTGLDYKIEENSSGWYYTLVSYGTLPVIVDKPKAKITINRTSDEAMFCEEKGFFNQTLSKKQCNLTDGKLIIDLDNNYSYEGNVSNAVFEIKIYSVCSGVCPSSPSGGGGGVDRVYSVTFTEEGTEKELKQDESARIVFGGAYHKIKVKEVGTDYADIEVSSDTIIFRLYVRESKKINLNVDNYCDLYIELKEIVGSKAKLVIQKIKEQILPTVPVVTPPVEEEVIEEAKPERVVEKEEVEKPAPSALSRKIPSKVYVFALIVVAIGSLTIFSFKKIKLRKISADVIYPESELYNYVKRKLKNGFDKKIIREAAVHAGWKKETVDRLFRKIKRQK